MPHLRGTLTGFCALAIVTVPASAAVVTGGAPDPTHSGLQLWLDASSGVSAPGGKVAGWEDRSAANHDAAQGDTALQPTYVASNPAFASRPTLNFQSGAVLATLDNASTMGVTGTADRTVFVAFRHAGGNADFMGYGTHGSGQIFDSSVYSGELMGHYYGGGFDTSGGGPAYASGDLAVMTHQYDYGTSTGVVSVFGKTVTAPVTASDSRTLALNTGDSKVTIGRGSYPLGAFSGDIAEILVYNEVLSPADRQAVEDYLFAKYTTPVPEPASAVTLLAAGALGLATRRVRRSKA